MTDTTVTATPPSSPAPAVPSPSAPPAAATPPASPGSTPTPTPSTPTAPTRPDWLPEKFPNLDEFGKHYNEVLTRIGAEDSRRLALPQKPEEYKVATTAAFKPPPGLTFEIKNDDPIWPQAQSWAHKHGLTQEAFNEGIDLFASARVGDAATIAAAHADQVAKMGVNGPARVTALETCFTGIVGAEGAARIKSMAVTADLVQDLEKIAAKFVSQGSATFSQSGREPPSGQKVTDEAYAKFSDREKLDYAKQFPQSQFQAA